MYWKLSFISNHFSALGADLFLALCTLSFSLLGASVSNSEVVLHSHSALAYETSELRAKYVLLLIFSVGRERSVQQGESESLSIVFLLSFFFFCVFWAVPITDLE